MWEEAPAAEQTRVNRWNLWPILGFPCRYDLNKPKPPRECIVQPLYGECYGGRPAGPSDYGFVRKGPPECRDATGTCVCPRIDAQGWWIAPRWKTELPGVIVH